ncbi:MAG: ABC transporter ATP-binding protein [Candidatus Caldarchaeum sp.]|nr:ABC transporter ATP-binding protein [Candidatus Caldarchaeum sp.]MDW8435382.1 ABC transporter ATP-binding protein [Candidatus Caldarchaeum sp.]
MAGSEAIVVEELTKKYGSFTAVDRVSFTVYEGEVFALLGPNGAGKTTTVEILECLRTPTSGNAFLKGLSIRDPSKTREIKKFIGVLPQEFHAVDNLTVYENVELSAAAKNADNVKDVLEQLGLWDIRNRMFSKLSGGLKRRVGIAMALVGNPEIIFLDEPTTGLDPEARRETWLYIKQLKKTRATVVLTTHYMEEAEKLSDRVAIIVKGKIAALGEVKQLVAEYGGKTKLVFEELDERAVSVLRERGYDVEAAADGRTVVKVEKDSEIFDILSTIKMFHQNLYPEIRQSGLEDVFLKVIGSKLSERGELI